MLFGNLMEIIFVMCIIAPAKTYSVGRKLCWGQDYGGRMVSSLVYSENSNGF